MTEFAGTGGSAQDDPGMETIESGSTTTADPTNAPGSTEETFIDPKDLPPELMPHFKRMQRSFTKRMQESKDLRGKAELVDRFYADPAYAEQVMQQRASQLGYSMTRAEARAAVQASSNGVQAPEELIRTVEQSLSPELKFMAKHLADAAWAAQQQTVAPLVQRQQAKEQQDRSAVYDDLAEELSESNPGWEEHEDEMHDLLNFLASPEMKSRQYGSKLRLLYDLVTRNASAISEATSRMNSAARNRIGTGQVTRTSVPNVEDQVRKAKTTQDAWEIAKRAASAISTEG